MTKELKWVSIVLAVLLAGWFINLQLQQRYVTKSGPIFPLEKDDIWGIVISKGDESLKLLKSGDTWMIDQVDSLTMRSQRIDNFFNKILAVKKETLVSTNPNKWDTFNVSDSLGTRLSLLDRNMESVGDAIFGRSKTDWSHNYVRFPEQENVYLTDQNVIYVLNLKADYWGEKPKPPEPDTTQVNTEP
ncbi:MAG: hypothetical protein ACE5D8_03125 [Fidelibacterota bacterium]